MTSIAQVVCILGMHRSGTSCLAGCLQAAGLFLGDVYTTAPHNKKGNRENKKIMALQEQILNDNQGAWDQPPQSINWSNEHKRQRDAIIEDYQHVSRWGFKDPRTLLTLSGWQEALPSLHFVGSFRHPLAVAASLAQRNKFTHEKSLTLWVHYNERLVELHDAFAFPLVCFDADAESYKRQIYTAAQALHLPQPLSAHAFYESTLKHQSQWTNKSLPSSIKTIYARLLAKTGY